jgi:hypothetical protein
MMDILNEHTILEIFKKFPEEINTILENNRILLMETVKTSSITEENISSEKLQYVADFFGALIGKYFFENSITEGIYPIFKKKFWVTIDEKKEKNLNLPSEIKEIEDFRKVLKEFLTRLFKFTCEEKSRNYTVNITPTLTFISKVKTIEEIVFISYIPLLPPFSNEKIDDKSSPTYLTNSILIPYQVLHHFREIKLLKENSFHQNVKHLLIFDYPPQLEYEAWRGMFTLLTNFPFLFKEITAMKFHSKTNNVLCRLIRYTDEKVNWFGAHIQINKEKALIVKNGEILTELHFPFEFSPPSL